MEFLLGIFVGGLLYYVFAERKKTSGTLIIDLSDPMSDNIFSLSVHENLNDIYMKKRVLLDVKTYENSLN